MATRKQTAARRKNIKKAQKARRRKTRRASASANPRRRKTRRTAAAANPTRRRKKARKPAKRRKTRRAAAAAAANPVRRKRRRKAAASAAANPRRRRRRSQANENSWYGQPRRHSKAAKKGVRRKKARRAARRRTHRDNPGTTPATNINVTASAPAGNPWPGQPRRHSKAAKKGWARRRRHGKGKAKGRGKKRCPPCRPRRGPGGQFAGGFTRRDNPLALGAPRLDNPYTPALYQNPFDTKSVVSYGAAAVTVALGLIAADLVDRAMATRKPAKGPTGTEAKRPWYGRDAAAAQRMRPDAWRLGAQAAGAVISLALAYFSRNIKVVPWLLGGFGLGFGANLLKKLSDWWLMPAILKVKDAGEESLANRLFPMEQADVQNEVTKMFENWDSVDSLKNQQQETALIQSPLGNPTTGPAYQLGKAQGDSAPASAVGSPNQRQFRHTGRLGTCPACGGQNGCYTDCGTLCPNCPEYNPGTSCSYTVEVNDDLAALARAGGVSIQDVNDMNGGSTPDVYWKVGNVVKLPYGMCAVIERQPSQPTNPLVPSAEMPPIMTQTVPSTMVPAVAGTPEPVLAQEPAQDPTTLFSLGSEEPEEDE